MEGSVLSVNALQQNKETIKLPSQFTVYLPTANAWKEIHV